MKNTFKKSFYFLFGTNNRRLAFLALWTLVWFLISIFCGFGEPSISHYLKKAFTPSKEHEELIRIWQGGLAGDSNHTAHLLWRPWLIFLLSLIATIIYLPVALREEMWELGRVIIDKIGAVLYEFKSLFGKASNPHYHGKDSKDKARDLDLKDKDLQLKKKELEILETEKKIKELQGAKKPSPPLYKKVLIDELVEIEEKLLEAEKKLRDRLREMGYSEEDIEAKMRELRQRIYERGS